MEARGVRLMGSGVTSLHLPLHFNTNLSLSPHRFFRNQTLSLKQTKQQSLFCTNSTTNGDDLESSRPLTHFPASAWGDNFLHLHLDKSEFDALEQEIESVMKPKVRDMLMSTHGDHKDKIRLVHLLISLGICHYFENEIEENLKQAFAELSNLIAEEDDLETISIMFEVFRLYGHKMSCDVFERFRDENEKFKESVAEDVRGMLQLYEAAHLAGPSENILDEALSFTRKHLESAALTSNKTTTNLSKHVQNALFRARYHNTEILVAREYISFYEQEQSCNKTILKFAKLNFNFCQLHFIQEIKRHHQLNRDVHFSCSVKDKNRAIIYLKHFDGCRWWQDINVASKVPFSIRDRVVETYYGAVGMLFEPRYSLGRIISTKLTLILTVVDDTCDAYATLPEVTSLMIAFQRWDLRAIEELPDYMKFIFQSVLETFEQIDQEMRVLGKSGSVQQAKYETKILLRVYLAIATWARTGHVPTFEEYMEVGLVTAAMDDYASYCYMAMDDCDQEELSNWFNSNPKIFQALNAFFRIRNDIVTYEQEMSRGEVANGVNCYMKQYDVSKEEAVKVLREMARENYKIMMNEFMTSKPVPRQILVRVINIGRVIDAYYKEGDAYGHPDKKLKHLLASLFLHPIPL